MPIIRDYTEENKIYIFDSHLDPDRSVYDERLLIDQETIESKHFWFQRRREKICKFIDRNICPSSRILEIGGGTGFIACELLRRGFSIEMADIHLPGLKFAREKGVSKLYQFDLYSPPFKDEFDLICFFDVLEHQCDDKKALECIKDMLKPNGKMLITVPAHKWLWNRDDKINGHYRRYTKNSLTSLCSGANLKILHLEYFFTAITPLLYLRTILNPDHDGAVSEKELLKFKISKPFNYICSQLTKAEFFLSHWIPNCVGGSLLLLAEKA